MSIKYIYFDKTGFDDIACDDADVIINAANGCGWMGGRQARISLCKGVAEHLNFYSNGLENAAMEAARRLSGVPSWIAGKRAGEVFRTPVTDAIRGKLKCEEVFHAVTMRYPGMKCKLRTVRKLVPQIFAMTADAGYKSVAMPCLGCGTGSLDTDAVVNIIKEEAKKYPELEVRIYINKESEINE